MFKGLFSRFKSESNQSDPLSELLERSTIPLWIGELYMHYNNLLAVQDINNPEWQNQAMYFWRESEPFERKSLPRHFENFEHLLFRVLKDIKVSAAKDMPWFGMPGDGTKMCFGEWNTPEEIRNVYKNGIIEYIDLVPLSTENAGILYDNDNYFWIGNPEVISFMNNKFYIGGEEVSVSHAYYSSYIRIGRIKRLI